MASIDDDFQYYNLEKDTDETFQNAQSFNTVQNTFIDSDIEDGKSEQRMIYKYYHQIMVGANLCTSKLSKSNQINPEEAFVNITIYDMLVL